MPAYKNKKDNSWYVKFNYKNWKGETKYTTKRGFSTKREALNYEFQFKDRISGNLNMLFSEFVKIYREEHYPRIRESTASVKDYIINNKILPYFANFKINDISVQDIMKWQNELITFKDDKTNKPYSKTYLKTIHNQISSIMNFAVKYYDLKENPAKKAGSIGKNNAEEMNIWTLEEYNKFSEVMMKYPLFFYCFEVLYWTGIREGELLALTYEDFDFNNKTIQVNKTYQRVRGENMVGPPKTEKSNRSVLMPDHLNKEMIEYFSLCYDKETNNRAFPTTKSALSRKMIKGSIDAKVKKIRIHDLRHSHVSLLINQGFNAIEIAKRLGHESITVTYKYAHIFPTTQQEMMNKLNILMNGEEQ